MLSLMILNSINNAQKKQSINEILQMNVESRKHGFELTEKEVEQMLEARDNCLQNVGRLELGTDVSKSIIYYFSSSAYITQQEYSAIINELHEVFYYMKNETEDRIGDDELIKIMKDFFENACGGSMELLKGKLQIFAEDFRKNNGQSNLSIKGE